ncbi:hypothetical protein JCM6882_003575 [Rhodosporidiobolus microsporus]
MAGGMGGALINRKALATTPSEVLNWYLYFAAAIIATSGGLHGYNSSNISGILKMHDFKESFDLNSYSKSAYADLSGWVTSIIVLGGLVGALISAPFNDYLGRRLTLYLTSIVYIVGCVIQIVTTSSIKQVIGARAMQGFAGGLSTVTGTMYLSEIAPRAIRGLLGALFSTNIMLGVALGYWSCYGSIMNISDNSHWQWRVPILVQFIPGITILLFLPFVIESPRWYAMKGKNERALSALVRLRRLPADHDFVLAEYTDIVNGIEAEKATSSASWLSLVKELRNDATLFRRFAVVMIAQLGFNFSGGNSITYYQTSILTTVGVEGDDAYLFSGVYGLIKVLSVFIYALFCAEQYGRRKMVLIGGVGNILCVTWIAIYLGALNGNKAGGWVSVAAICLFAVFYGIGWAPNAFGLNGEVFPNRLRAKFMSLAIGLQYLANFLLVKFFPVMVNNITAKGPFIIFAVVSTAIVIFMFFALPEVKGVGIEHMSSLFAGPWYSNGVRSAFLNRRQRDEEAANAASVRDDKAVGSAEYVEEVKMQEGELKALENKVVV